MIKHAANTRNKRYKLRTDGLSPHVTDVVAGNRGWGDGGGGRAA